MAALEIRRKAWFEEMVAIDTAEYLLGRTFEIKILHDSDKNQRDVTPPIPIVLLSVTNKSSTQSILETVREFHQKDDVVCNDFLNYAIVYQGGSPLVEWDKVHVSSDELGPVRFLEIEYNEVLPQGPYFLTHDNLLAEAWRLFPDSQDAFCTTFVPKADEPYEFEPLRVAGDGFWRQVAVPSRLYTPASDSKPLGGVRVSIKDNFKIAGIKTTQTNRAFVDTYGPEHETAEYVKQLIRLGAVIVGKTKMCAFASSEEATDQWIDFHAPFNPRADGYQTPSGSTTGGATALATYNWLDFSIGTDTTGSVRWPAAWNGLFGMRSSWDTKALTGVYPSCRSMVTLGLLSRDISRLQSLLVSSIPTLKDYGRIDQFPARILYCTDFFPHSTPAQQQLIDEFVTHLEEFLQVKRTNVSIAERWKQCPPVEAGGKDIRTYLNKTAYYPFYYDGYHEFAQFRQDYEKKFGKPVYVGPYMRWKWDQGSGITLDEVKQASRELDVYRDWFAENIMKPEPNGRSDAILVVPCGSGEPKYRDLPNSAPRVVPAFSPNYVASMLGLPQLVLPVGQIPFTSRISKRNEYLPIVASIMGAQNSDLMLVELGKEVLKHSQRPTTVETGRFMFKLDA